MSYPNYDYDWGELAVSKRIKAAQELEAKLKEAYLKGYLDKEKELRTNKEGRRR